jgi:adenylate cyclase
MTAARRLAAILAADIAGYSRLMGEDEAGTAEAVRERREAATPIVRGFGGSLPWRDRGASPHRLLPRRE